MIHSMTGFGQSEHTASGWRCRVEMRSVNGRYLDIRARFPAGLGHMEEPFKQRVKARCKRGKFEVSITLLPDGGAEDILRVNRPLLQGYKALLAELETTLERPVTVSLGDLMANRELIQSSSWEAEQEAVEELLEQTLAAALEDLVSMRSTEGASLRDTLLEQIAQMEDITARIHPLAASLPEVYARKLRDNLARLAGGESVPEERIAQEIALFAERCDTSEEFTRLATHFQHMRELLDGDGEVGKKMDFLIQELNRETNTLGVKSTHVEINALIIELKSTIEKIREQVQNIV